MPKDFLSRLFFTILIIIYFNSVWNCKNSPSISCHYRNDNTKCKLLEKKHRFYLVFISDIILHMYGGTYVALVYLLMLNVNDI